MKVVTAEEMARIDNDVIENLGIPGSVLMERAGLALFNAVTSYLNEKNFNKKRAVIIAGKGNNGGDGLVLARQLLPVGNLKVDVILLADRKQLTGDTLNNYIIASKLDINILELPFEKDWKLNSNKIDEILSPSDIIIDAVLGTGISGAARGNASKAIALVNKCDAYVISVDIPSGLEGSTGRVHGKCIKADQTVTFGYPKIGLLLYPGAHYSGKLTISDIGIPEQVVQKYSIKKHLLTDAILDKFRSRKSNTHKGDYGQALVIACSPGMTGAGVLSAEAALRWGAGLVTLAVPKNLNSTIEQKLTEVMTLPTAARNDGTFSKKAYKNLKNILINSSACAFGPGISRGEDIYPLLKKILLNTDIPLVIDADGLNVLASNGPDILKKAENEVALTPHPGEMARLLGISTEQVQKERIEYAVKAAKRWGVVVVLKGARTIIASPDGELYINSTGNPGMATGGSGDVLTGIILAHLAEGMDPLSACCAGVYIHGIAGDCAVRKMGERSLTAADIIDGLSDISRKIMH